MSHLRRTNLDRICRTLEERAAPGDLVLLSPFWLAPGFKYHYHGKAEWDTLPLTSTDEPTSLLPAAAIEPIMRNPSGLDPTLRKVESTLSGGNRVWIVGGLSFQSGGGPPVAPPPAPHPRYGWHCGPYIQSWSAQVAYLLQTRAAQAGVVPVPVEERVSPLENSSLLVFEGWR